MLKDLGEAEAELGPKTTDIQKLQKDVKALISQEVEGRIKEGQSTLDVVDNDLSTCHDSHNIVRKKLKNFRDQIEKAKK